MHSQSPGSCCKGESEIMKQGECFKCSKPVMVEKVGEWPNGKAKWKTYEMDGSTVHPHSPIKDESKAGGHITAAGAGIEQWAAIGIMLEDLRGRLNETNEKLRDQDVKMDRIIAILKGQQTLGQEGNE